MIPAEFNKNLAPSPLSSISLADAYLAARYQTLRICDPLEVEDYVVQPVAETSPPKWHLAHTTWFFEYFILERFAAGHRTFNEKYFLLFNSYYKTAGDHWPQSERGTLSRPTVDEIHDYRKYVDEAIIGLIHAQPDNPDLRFLIEAGIHHEQQHQELLYMDIKYILASNPLQPRYSAREIPAAIHQQTSPIRFEPGIREIGAGFRGFSYDNERPRHKVWLDAFSISSSLVTNGEMLEFIADGGYTDPRLWLSKGWDWIGSNNLKAPLYWRRTANGWQEFTLHGTRALDPDAPLCHVSYFEADAFARWRGGRLPTEQELEIFLSRDHAAGDDPDRQPDYGDRRGFGIIHPHDAASASPQAWCWTQSHYSPYPGFKAFEGSLGEYNGKFMCGQFVLRGGCVATPAGHYRPSYRNFFEPHHRWMFSGIRLAGD